MLAGFVLMMMARKWDNDAWKARARWDIKSGRTLLHYGAMKRHRAFMMRESLESTGDLSMLR